MNTLLKKLIWFVFFAPAIYLLIIWKKLPGIIPLHYNLHGEPDRFGPKKDLWVLIGILFLLNLLVYSLLSRVHLIDPRKRSAENAEKMQRMAFAISLFISTVSMYIVHYTANPGIGFKVQIILVGIGLLFAFMGNYMHTIKPNHVAGFRISYTLNNEENWRKTHLLGGKLWFTGGLVIPLTSLFLPQLAAIISAGIILLVMILVPGIYSYRLYKKQNLQHSN